MDPFQLTIGLVESALKNGVRILLNTEVIGIVDNDGVFTVETDNASFNSGYVINSAGLYSDEIAGMVGIDRYRIYPCRGEYHVLDKRVGDIVERLIYPVPPKDSGGLGVHITPTVDGNIMLGPSADYIDDVCDVANTSDVMEQLYEEARAMLPKLGRGDFIRSFSGIRSKLVSAGSGKVADFVIEGYGDVHGFIIAEMVVAIYGRIICRCELVSRGEVIDAINNPPGVRSINGIKVRSRVSTEDCGDYGG